jgi:hypothetical protein
MPKLIQYRQGDVLVERYAGQLPLGLEPIKRESGRVILAHGEVTGHAHAIKRPNAALFRDPKLAAIFLQVTGDGPALLEHEEHTTITLEPGDYQVIRQREYHPESIRQVED